MTARTGRQRCTAQLPAAPGATVVDQRRDLVLPVLGAGARFAMQSWDPPRPLGRFETGDQPTGPSAWRRMNDVKWPDVRRIWAPRPDAIAAAMKCLGWTGLIGIPAMQVVDLETGDVMWRDARVYPDAGPSVRPA